MGRLSHKAAKTKHTLIKMRSSTST